MLQMDFQKMILTVPDWVWLAFYDSFLADLFISHSLAYVLLPNTDPLIPPVWRGITCAGILQ